MKTYAQAIGIQSEKFSQKNKDIEKGKTTYDKNQKEQQKSREKIERM